MCQSAGNFFLIVVFYISTVIFLKKYFLKICSFKKTKILFIVIITTMYMRNRDENDSTYVSQINPEASYRKD